MEKLAFTVEEMAESLGISRSKAYELVHIEDFPVIHCGRRLMIPIEPLKKWLNETSASGWA